jgi:transglutaminase-like putative cysteine protease
LSEIHAEPFRNEFIMNNFLKSLAVLILALCPACGSKHLITDKEYLSLVEKSFKEKEQLASGREDKLFSVFDDKLSTEQSEALKFLFAFMPLNDLADFDGEFFLANVDKALLAKTETPWGKDIPEDIFLHYVLPCRINNENLDSFRIVYFDEIMARVKGREIRDAALEINHWCHEKVSYQPADIRTSAPMSTILSARGRCGEESTFTVAALRTAGIPARQVYTPRWAHSDDNHAWVEIWSDGEWNYMGACEPEPVLDLGWFTEPARRAMLVHTKSFGAPYGEENAINKYSNYTDVNNLSKYAVTRKIIVKVLDKQGLPVDNASVEYQLYNYAEFYPLAVVPTDKDGISRFETGLGDLLIWTYKNDDFDYKKISVSETDTLIMHLTRNKEDNYSLDLDLDVPVLRSPLPVPSAAVSEQNSKRINEENLLRQKYIDSWMKPDDSKALASKIKADPAKIEIIISKSMGNYKEINAFLSKTPDSLITLAVSLLEILADKDLRDIKAYILSDHLTNTIKSDVSEGEEGVKMFQNYILNPRVANEMVVDWRGYFREKLPSELLEKASADPLMIVNYLDKNIKIADEENYYKTPLTPRGVIELKVSDEGSRAICFIAICRTLGIPSRLEPGRNVPQYYLNSTWNDVFFADQKEPASKKGYIKLQSTDTKPVPEYYIHFTLARFENGRYNTLEYDYNKKISDFRDELALPPGRYMLVTGNRLNDSKILSEITFFGLSENEHKTLDIKIRRDIPENKISGKINLKNVVDLLDTTKVSQSDLMAKGIVIIWIEPDKEPTKHIFNDLPLLKQELDNWGGYFLFLSGSVQQGNSFNPSDVKGLPDHTYFGTDDKMAVLFSSVDLKPMPDVSLPFVVLSDNKGNILFTSTGYRIGIGEQILKHIH